MNVSPTHKTNTFNVYITTAMYWQCSVLQHQSTECVIYFFNILISIQFKHSVATTTQVNQHFKQGISHSGTTMRCLMMRPPWENTLNWGRQPEQTATYRTGDLAHGVLLQQSRPCDCSDIFHQDGFWRISSIVVVVDWWWPLEDCSVSEETD